MAATGRNAGGGAFARRFSLEVTRPRPDEITSLAQIVGPGVELYLSAVPTQSFRDLADTAALVRRAGLEPVTHLPARRMENAAALADFLARLRDGADARQVLLVAGDVDTSGLYPDALSVIRGGALQKAGIDEIGISGYPEGHPKFPAEQIERALHDKLAAAQESGLSVHIVSQFCFDPEKIVAWIKRLRSKGITVPIQIGMAGPTSITALLRYAKRCGVNASMRGLMSGAAASLLGNVGPDRIIETLEAAGGEIGDAEPHYFSFGGALDTARYARDMALGASAPKAMTGSL